MPRRDGADHEPGGDEAVQDGDLDGTVSFRRRRFDRDAVLVADSRPTPRLRDSAENAAAVEKADRQEVGRVQEEAVVRELEKPRGAVTRADRPDCRRRRFPPRPSA